MTSPLNLPDGSVRAILAISLTGVTIYLWGTSQPVPPELLATTGLVVGNYFGSRGALPPGASPDAPEDDGPLGAPYIPGEDAEK